MLGSLALTAALWVGSDPAGASVYVDGRLTGQTPLTVQLAAGNHRVRLIKDGYLANSRTITVPEQGSTKLHVALTRDMTAAAVSAQGSGGGSTAWVWLAAAGGAAAVAGIYVAHRNHPPVGGSVTVAPAAVGMAEITTFSFGSTANDEDGDALVYRWNFGDGGTSTSTSKTPTHVYQSTGTFNVTLQVSDGKAAAVAATGATVTVAPALTGTWTGVNAIPFFPCGITFTATQNGSVLSGFFRFTPGAVGCNVTPPIAIASASVNPLSYPATVTWTSEPFSFAFLPGPLVIADLSIRFTGTTNDGGTSVTGTFQIVRAGVVVVTSSLTFTK